uniref:Major facilitator superfamily (MFS) profile domain-containing protein n=1 Tax=Romanomermis culicivorax TaxID=13658 RepID=A0A915K3F8_ROMCU
MTSVLQQDYDRNVLGRDFEEKCNALNGILAADGNLHGSHACLNVTHSDYALPQGRSKTNVTDTTTSCSSEPLLYDRKKLLDAYCAGKAVLCGVSAVARRCASFLRGGEPTAAPLINSTTTTAEETATHTNVKFATQSTPPNSFVDMSSADYLAGSKRITFQFLLLATENLFSSNNHPKLASLFKEPTDPRNVQKLIFQLNDIQHLRDNTFNLCERPIGQCQCIDDGIGPCPMSDTIGQNMHESYNIKMEQPEMEKICCAIGTFFCPLCQLAQMSVHKKNDGSLLIELKVGRICRIHKFLGFHNLGVKHYYLSHDWYCYGARNSIFRIMFCLSNANVSNSNIRDSYSAKDHHEAVRDIYRRTRKRHFTDPVDFEGILRMIGGCGWWQIYIYFFVSLQQIPHAMFNLSVIYMMFKPDHWCYQDWFDPLHHDKFGGWTSEQIRNITSPIEYDELTHTYKQSQCRMFNRGSDAYHDLSHRSFENATLLADNNFKIDLIFTVLSQFMKSGSSCLTALSSSSKTWAYCSSIHVSTKTCDKWVFDKSVMEETIVTQWGLVCGNNFHRADAQLAYALGYFFGCFVSGLSSDRFGRRPTVIVFGVLASFFGIVLPYSTYFPMFLLLRFFSAVCNEAADLAAYVLCMEITGTKHRASVGSFLQLPWAIGYTLLALVAYLTKSWRTIQIITAIAHTVTIIMFICVLPESPRWLIVNNRLREAERIIRNACRMNHSELPADLELTSHVEQRKWVKRNERANLLHVFKSCDLIVRTIVIFFVWVATALVYYGISLNLSDQSAPGVLLFRPKLQKADEIKAYGIGRRILADITGGAADASATAIVCDQSSSTSEKAFKEKYGRKRSQMGTLIMAGIMMVCVVLSPDVGYVRLVLMLIGKMFIQGAFNILYIFTSELYPTVIRNSAVGICSMVARMGAGVTGYLAILSDITLPFVPMLIFGVFSLVAATMVIFLPETQDRPLPDTLQDAVVFLKPNKYPVVTYCAYLGGLLSNSNKNHRHDANGESDYSPSLLDSAPYIKNCSSDTKTTSISN